ncbi:hypothetical protein AADG42_11410 [Ammonicoccus fulvus]|uniref:DUF4179 domain-containing protein n=1 Tax=Ammonicoccus fulvus TaxID=3138240 RepID=A0ABZ3FR84_9ACTN
MSTDDDTRLDDLLRSFDAADPELDDLARRRGDALLERILATPMAEERGTSVSKPTPLAPRRTRLRWLAIPAAAAAFALVASLWPGFGSRGQAYASWTPTPIPVTGELRDKTTDACVTQLASVEKDYPGQGPERPVAGVDTARILIAEQRGDYVFVAVATDVGANWSCLFEARRPNYPISAGGGIPSAMSPAPAPLAPEQLEGGGGGMSGSREGSFASTQGRVGSDVRGVTIHAGGKTVEASVNDGTFAAWWPIEDFKPSLVDNITFDVTLSDGRVLTNVDGGIMSPMPGPREVGRVSLGAGTDNRATIDGFAGDEVSAVTVHLPGGREFPAAMDGRSFHVGYDLPKGTYDPGIDTVDLTFTLTLTDGTVLPHTKAITR